MRTSIVILMLCLAAGTGFAADQAVPASPAAASEKRLPEVQVVGEGLSEETPVGDNQQPEWTTHRRFATVRAYVQQPWETEVETWWKGKFPKHGASDNLFQEEISLGLPNRFQFDVYENMIQRPEESLRHQGEAFEVRYAFADWGKLPLNPTIYVEWKNNEHDASAGEVKLLFAEELAPRWHWAMNVFAEQEFSAARSTELGWSQGVSYTLIDQKLSVGVEMQNEITTEKRKRNDPEVEFLIGPSLQWRPTRNTHLDLVPLLGATPDSPRVEAYVVFGISFGAGSESRAEAPVSTRSR